MESVWKQSLAWLRLAHGQTVGGEAALHVSYLLHVVSLLANSGLTLYVALFGRKPKIRKLRVFGCPVQAFVPEELRKEKFESNTTLEMFLGWKNGFFKVWINKEIMIVLLKIGGSKKTSFLLKMECQQRIVLHKNHGIET